MNSASCDLTPLSDGRPGIRSIMPIEIRAPSDPQSSNNDPQPVLDFISSDETLDRYGEIISASGWRLDTYRRNPVFQNAHQYGDIIFTLGRALITELRTGSAGAPAGAGTAEAPARQVLFQRIQFATDVNPVARIAYGLYSGGFLRSVSVGFLPIRWEDDPNRVGQASSPAPPAGVAQTFRRKYIEQELLEVSAVAIPANPNALALAVKSGAVEKSDLRDTLDLLRQTLDPEPINRANLRSILSLTSEIKQLLKRI